jgi:hypothetical protein
VKKLPTLSFDLKNLGLRGSGIFKTFSPYGKQTCVGNTFSRKSFWEGEKKRSFC